MSLSFPKENHLFFQYLDYFSSKLEGTLLDNVIKIPPHIGTGNIKWYLPEDGFGIRFYDIIPNQDIEYNLFSKEESGAVYKLIFVLEKELSLQADNLNNNNAYLYFSDFQKTIKIKRGEHVCRLVLVFKKEWLQKNHPTANARLVQLLATLIQNNQSTSIHEELDRKCSFIIRQMIEMMDRSSFPPLVLKTNLFLLLNNFLDKFISYSKKKYLPVDP